jgi:hypothetical protein
LLCLLRINKTSRKSAMPLFDCTFLMASGMVAVPSSGAQADPRWSAGLFATDTGAGPARWPSVPPSPHPYAAGAAAPTPLPLATPATPCACASAKAGCAERQYTIEQLRLAAHSILSAAKSGKPLAAATAARQQGAPSMRLTLTRLMDQVWELDGPGPDQAGFGLDKWLVRSDYVNAYEFAKKGNDDFTARRIFSDQDEALIKEGCDLAAASGMGLDFITVRDIMNMFIAKEDLKDPPSSLHSWRTTVMRKSRGCACSTGWRGRWGAVAA